ncbi:F-box protein SKIP23-like [Mangifera indica]|uniref:F-box protein SKIP23-like n=1 Tax=Mangifera indica TaxID=29780 RepID=UPI001CFB79D4|nr:F-box protein SKIP23-like [Mangifera indica]
MGSHGQQSHDWSSFPDQLLATIADRLPTRIDTLRFRAICTSFRAAFPPPPPPNLYPDIHYFHQPPIHFFIAQPTVYAIQPLSQVSHPYHTPGAWLVKVEYPPSGDVKLLDPFSTSQVKNVSDKLPGSFNLLDHRIKEISKGYRLELARDQQRELSRSEQSCTGKVVVSADEDDNDDELAIMVLIQGKVVVWKRRDNKWHNIDIVQDRFHFIYDIIYHNRRFYVLSYKDGTLCVDPKSLNVSEPVAPLRISLSRSASSFHLVKSSPDLFLIRKNYLDFPGNYDSHFCGKSSDRSCQAGLNIFKLDEGNDEWVVVKDGFQDRAFFMLKECNFFLSAQEFSGLKWKCVYLPDRGHPNVDCDYPGSNALILTWKIVVLINSQLFLVLEQMRRHFIEEVSGINRLQSVSSSM